MNSAVGLLSVGLILKNPRRRRRPDQPAAGAGASPLSFHRGLPGYAPTPLVQAPHLAADLGVGELWVKDESSRLGLPAFKVLGASWATYRALAARLGVAPGTWTTLDEVAAAAVPLLPLRLVAATDGNHGRAVARMAALLGLDATILVPAGTAAARIDAIASEGASVEVVDGTYDEAVAQSATLASDRALVVSDTSWPGYADIPGWVIDGYSTIFAEADAQLAAAGAAAPDVVVVQMGVGALAAAVVRHYRARDEAAATDADGPLIVVVEPVSAACGLRSVEAGHPVDVPGPHDSIMAGLNCGHVSDLAWPTVAAGVDLFVAVEDGDAERAMRDLAAAGLESGETGAAGLAGLRALIEAGELPDAERARVLVISTEGATDPDAYRRVVGHDVVAP
ncbi:MAG: Pyridoxal-5-phosphate-dependent enzyme beta subunit [Acidimicrobiales bacterium]|nr:Pyridoxal-5-phosphate-dependent enzyme beta subunit [Acidimicrobiales bacterium]